MKLFQLNINLEMSLKYKNMYIHTRAVQKFLRCFFNFEIKDKLFKVYQT